MIIENIVCTIVGILIGYAGMYVAGYKLPRIKELRNYDCERRIRSHHEEHHQTKHALWMARALRAKIEAKRFFWFLSVDVSQGNREAEIWHESLYKKWCWVERKCLAKAEEYK